MSETFNRVNGEVEPAEAEALRGPEGDSFDQAEVETFDPKLGPPEPEGKKFDRVPGPVGPLRPKKDWRRVADTRPMPKLDPDVYTTKKSVAAGFMDIALLAANADQLRTLVRNCDSTSPFYVVCIIFLSLSIVVQVLIAIVLLLKTRYNINRPDHFRRSEVLNNVAMIASVFLTAFNVLATSFMSEVPPRVEPEAQPNIFSLAQNPLFRQSTPAFPFSPITPQPVTGST